MTQVTVGENEGIESALRRFKRQCNHAGVFAEIKEKSFFQKPTTERRLAKLERMRVIKRAERMRRNARF